MRRRKTETHSEIDGRLAIAQTELAAKEEFDYTVVNDSIERAADELYAILCAEGVKPS